MECICNFHIFSLCEISQYWQCLVIHLGRWRCIESRPPKRAVVKTAELSYGRP